MADSALQFNELVDAGLAARLKQLMLFSRYRVEGMFAGDNKSVKKGVSSDFLQHRQYFPGDNLKYLDWRVLARTERYVIREFEETTNLDLYLVVDNSASMGFGSGSLNKHQFAVRVAAALIYLMMQQKDSFGLALFAREITGYCAPAGSARHLQRLYRMLLGATPAGEADWEGALPLLQARIRRKGLVVVLSDFMADPEAICRGLTGFRSIGCDVIAFHLVDPFETELTQNHMTRFIDIEDGSALTVDPLLVRPAYKRQFQQHCEAVGEACRSRGIACTMLAVGDNYEEALGEYLRKRMGMLL